jgi:hypothetical protein
MSSISEARLLVRVAAVSGDGAAAADAVDLLLKLLRCSTFRRRERTF